jgi:hypothetical protein
MLLKKSKKLLILVLSVLMVLSFSSSVLAAPGTNFQSLTGSGTVDVWSLWGDGTGNYKFVMKNLVTTDGVTSANFDFVFKFPVPGPDDSDDEDNMYIIVAIHDSPEFTQIPVTGYTESYTEFEGTCYTATVTIVEQGEVVAQSFDIQADFAIVDGKDGNDYFAMAIDDMMQIYGEELPRNAIKSHYAK